MSTPNPRRYIVIGAGGVGVALAAGLQEAGLGVLLVSRGESARILRESGVSYTQSGRRRVLPVAIADGAAGVDLTPDDVLVLTTKTQDAEAALAEWAVQPVAGRDGGAGRNLPLVTTQNGLDAERSALRRFDTVLAGTALISAQHVAPGDVRVLNTPKAGQLILGAVTDSAAPLLDGIVADVAAANWLVQGTPQPLAWKAWKLTVAATFAVEVLHGEPAELEALRTRVREEARAVLLAAGHTLADPESELRYEVALAGIDRDTELGGGHLSTWQSFARGVRSEIDFLAGEVALQARLAGISAPVNSALQQVLVAAGAAGDPVLAHGIAEVNALIAAAEHELVPAG